MNLHRTAVLLMIASGVLTSIEAEAQARGRPVTESRQQARLSDAPAAVRTQQLAELHAWLGRLVGRFEATSTFDMAMIDFGGGYVLPPDPPQRYILQCSAVGSGSGVLCMYEATDRTVGELPLARLFGVDAKQVRVHVLEIDGTGHARESFGSLKDDTVILDRECPGAENCAGSATLRIRAPPGRRNVQMYIEWDAKVSRIGFRRERIGSRTELRRQ
jgi:hypothetical protein